MLHYLVKLIKRNNESLLGLRDDLRHLKDAEFVVLDSLCGEIRSLKDEIEPVLQIVKAQAEDLEEKGQLIQMSIKELAEQKTSVRTVGCVPLYNKMEHHTGRTPMERFALNAAGRIEDALSYTESVKIKFSKVLDYFGEDSSMASNEFFGTLNTFLNDFSKAVDHVSKEEIAKVCRSIVICSVFRLLFLSLTTLFSFFNRQRKLRKKQSVPRMSDRSVSILENRVISMTRKISHQ